jgi:hypothetical protein
VDSPPLIDQKVIDYVHAQPDDLTRMHWRQFEYLVGESSGEIGWTRLFVLRHQGSTGDGCTWSGSPPAACCNGIATPARMVVPVATRWSIRAVAFQREGVK